MNINPDGEHFDRLNFCSNIIEDYGSLIKVDGNFIPLIIERGTVPYITLNVSQRGGGFFTIVHRNMSRAPEVAVSVSGNKVQVYAHGTMIISAITINESEAEIDALNLEPIGLLIKGDRNGLKIAGNSISNSRFSRVGSIIGIGN